MAEEVRSALSRAQGSVGKYRRAEVARIINVGLPERPPDC